MTLMVHPNCYYPNGGIDMDNVRTIMADLPNTIGGYTIRQDDFYTIILNQNLSHDKNMITYAHEISHIKNNDFESNCSAGLIEIFAHK